MNETIGAASSLIEGEIIMLCDASMKGVLTRQISFVASHTVIMVNTQWHEILMNSELAP